MLVRQVSLLGVYLFIAFDKPVMEAWKLIVECHTRNIIWYWHPYVQQEWNCCFNWLVDIVFNQCMHTYTHTHTHTMASVSYVNKVRLIWRKISVERTCINSLGPSDAIQCHKFCQYMLGNGMLPDGTKLLPAPMLTSVCLSNSPRKFLSLIVINDITQYMTLNMIFQKGHKA